MLTISKLENLNVQAITWVYDCELEIHVLVNVIEVMSPFGVPTEHRLVLWPADTHDFGLLVGVHPR